MTTYYQGPRGIAVTDRFLRTSSKDMALGPISTIHIGRMPFHIAIGIAVGLLAFVVGFSDLLYLREQIVLVVAALAFLAAGYSVASLQVGSYVHVSTVLWGSLWTVRRVRMAIVDARANLPDQPTAIGVIAPEHHHQ